MRISDWSSDVGSSDLANPLAAQAGLDILHRGGSAIDAAIAVQMMLNLVEPQSSGIGGGALILYWDARQKLLYAYDGRETRSEEHTSELQSLMRISYAVFCLQKKKRKQ